MAETREECCTIGACPFAYNEISEQAQNLGCLPSPFDILVMKLKYNKSWACHSNPTKACLGAKKSLKKNGLMANVVGELITEEDDWMQYTKVTENEMKMISKLIRNF